MRESATAVNIVQLWVGKLYMRKCIPVVKYQPRFRALQ
jgi:hypothetical protein